MSKEDRKHQRFPWRVYWLALAFIVVLAFLPVAGVLASSWFAETYGCTLNEGDVHPCVVGGLDWGEELYFMFVMGWLMLASLPLGGVALGVWLIAFVGHLAIWKRRKLRPR